MTDDMPADDRTPARTTGAPNVAFLVLGLVFVVVGIPEMSAPGPGSGTAYFAVGVVFLVLGGAFRSRRRRGQRPGDDPAPAGDERG